ncbi:MAG: hypothetical protein IPK82_18835 [Polyangiaceae bacterium]|nr:hypothetical protein [Polyangiaceae bacterium]
MANTTFGTSTQLALAPSDHEVEIRAIRTQAAVVRSLLDELDRLVPYGTSPFLEGAIAAQTMEELMHLGCRIMQLANAVSPKRVLEVCDHPCYKGPVK